jgi:hypothetical protein
VNLEDSIKKISDILSSQLGEDIDENTVNDLAGLIKQCEDCIINVDSVQQTINLARTGDYGVLIPPKVSKRLFKVLDLDEE